MNDPLISAAWLNKKLQDPELIILDASQASNKSGISTAHDQLQITGARSFDLKSTFSNKSSHLPVMLPEPAQFEEECRALGINKTSKIVIYDNLGIYFSPRVWWMFRTMGHEEVYVLNGGLPEWINQGFPIQTKRARETIKGDFRAYFHKNVQDYDFIKRNIESKEYILIDARPADRFDGIAAEPREGLRSGNIPYSVNLPFKNVLVNGKYKSKKDLRKLFSSLQIDLRPLIFSCGSGVTACIVLLACEMVLPNEKSIYDGSWTEWAEK